MAATVEELPATKAVFLPVVFSAEDKTDSNTIVIHLEEAERSLFATVRTVLQQLSANIIGAELPNKHVQVRVAGGWVRDKILGKPSDDIDLAIENYTGVQFAELLREYRVSMGCPPQKIGVIATNPAQSKHLETACMRLEGLDIDLCHLRSHEVYTNSRIPDSVTFGTPLEDAERRDFTCNALFYNIETQQIEDWTGRGCTDLENGNLVTPLEPLTTFLDDPLRVLRAIRFAIRYNYTIASADTIRSEPSIREALLAKVSRERVGKELEGMLSGKAAKPAAALRMIVDLGLADVVFSKPQLSIQCEGWQKRGLSYLERMEKIKSSLDQATTTSVTCAIDERLLPLLALLLPLRKATYNAKKNKVFPAVHYVLSESLKFSKKDAEAASTIFVNLDRFLGQIVHFEKVECGLLFRETRGLWVTALALAAIESGEDVDVASSYHNMLELDGCWTIPPLLDGKSLIKELELKPGPTVGKYMQEQVKWMLAHPTGSVEECLEHLQKKRKVL